MELSQILTEGDGEYRRGFQNSILPFTWSEEWMVPPVRLPGDPDACEFFFPLNDGTNNVVGCHLSAATRNAGAHVFVPVNRTCAVRVRLCAIHARWMHQLTHPSIGISATLCEAPTGPGGQRCGRPWHDVYHGPEELCPECRVKTDGHESQMHHDFA